MKPQKIDERLRAFNEIVQVMASLDSESQSHVLNSVASWLNLDAPPRLPSSAAPQSYTGSESVQVSHSFSRPDGDASPKEFLFSKNPQTNTERIACLAFYLTHYRSVPHFKTLELSRLNTEAAQPKFTNASYSLRDATTAGLLVSGPKGTKQLSAMGEQFVMALPDRSAAREVIQKMKPKRRKKAPTKKSRG